MSYSDLAQIVALRLDQSPRGDHGWWLTTRVHLTTARVRDVAAYLLDAGAAAGRALTDADYDAIGKLVGVGGENPGQTLRRHQLLAMETPLRLLERTDGRSWDRVQLTPAGLELAIAPDPAAVLEQALSAIVFCSPPFFTLSRVAEYRDFNVRPYLAAAQAMSACDGWIDRDEYDLFLSRIRTEDEISWAVSGIRSFRELAGTERVSLLREVRNRIPAEMGKVYQNWRDMGLHTFSLFALGIGAIRTEQRLILSARYLENGGIDYRQSSRPSGPRTRARAVRERRKLLIPEPAAGEELSVPPTKPATNSGADAEILVGKLLQGDGWDIVYYSNRRGFGFDIWARKGKAALLVEVKSSVNSMGEISLTRLEHAAAEQHADNYLIAVVENISSEDPLIRFVTNPVHTLRVETRTLEAYVISRDEWERAARESQA